MNAADLGTGATVVFGTSAFTMNLTNISHDEISREAIETTHLGTTATAGKIGSKTFIPGDLADGGKVTLEGHFDADNLPPVEGAVETVTITMPKGTGETTGTKYSFDAFVTSFSYTLPLEDLCTASIEVKVTGPITKTAAV